MAVTYSDDPIKQMKFAEVKNAERYEICGLLNMSSYYYQSLVDVVVDKFKLLRALTYDVTFTRSCTPGLYTYEIGAIQQVQDEQPLVPCVYDDDRRYYGSDARGLFTLSMDRLVRLINKRWNAHDDKLVKDASIVYYDNSYENTTLPVAVVLCQNKFMVSVVE